MALFGVRFPGDEDSPPELLKNNEGQTFSFSEEGARFVANYLSTATIEYTVEPLPEDMVSIDRSDLVEKLRTIP